MCGRKGVLWARVPQLCTPFPLFLTPPSPHWASHTQGINLFAKDYVVIPIHDALHWSLAIICHPGEQLRSMAAAAQDQSAAARAAAGQAAAARAGVEEGAPAALEGSVQQHQGDEEQPSSRGGEGASTEAAARADSAVARGLAKTPVILHLDSMSGARCPLASLPACSDTAPRFRCTCPPFHALAVPMAHCMAPPNATYFRRPQHHPHRVRAALVPQL